MSEKVISFNPKLLELFSETLTDNERDNLKYRLSLCAIKELEKSNYSKTQYNIHTKLRVNNILSSLISIQPYRDRIPEYGMVYRGRPEFISDETLNELIMESERFRPYARLNNKQYLYQVETPNNVSFSEVLSESKELHELVCKYAGPVLNSYITSYIYYDKKGHCSRAHVDNAFTSITVMLGLKQQLKPGYRQKLSSSFIYWPNKKPLEYRLFPGEISIFFGACVLHGRSRLDEGEATSSLLMSFRPQALTQ